jgi:peptide/nickel transport system substrate-binding protein
MSGAITSFMMLYALHDAVLKPMPDQPMAPSLAEDWSATKDGLSYEFTLREGAMFHRGDPVTADDVKFSFERYRGADHLRIKERIAAVEILDSTHIRFKLKEPWPDFPTFYVNASGAGWVVPRRYVEKVGDDGFKVSTLRKWGGQRCRVATGIGATALLAGRAAVLGVDEVATHLDDRRQWWLAI